MELSGKVIKILDPQSGNSSKGGWWRGGFVIETEGEYPKKCVFSVFGKERWDKMGIAVGGTYNISFDIDAREYNGRWYNDIQAWKAVRIDAQGAQQSEKKAESPVPNAKPAPKAAPQGEKADELPF